MIWLDCCPVDLVRSAALEPYTELRNLESGSLRSLAGLREQQLQDFKDEVDAFKKLLGNGGSKLTKLEKTQRIETLNAKDKTASA